MWGLNEITHVKLLSGCLEHQNCSIHHGCGYEHVLGKEHRSAHIGQNLNNTKLSYYLVICPNVYVRVVCYWKA